MNLNRILSLALCLAVAACNGGVRHGDGHEEHAHMEGQGAEATHTGEGHAGDVHADEAHGHADDIHAGEAHGHAGEISLPAEKALAAGVVSEIIRPGTFRDVIVTGGDVESAPGDAVTVVANVSGVVAFTGTMAEGLSVAKGQQLFSIKSDGLLDGDPVSRARIEYEAAKAEYERASGLVDDRIVSQKDFIRIKEAYENARMAYEALKPNADGSGVQIEAPFDGYIRDIFVNEGDFVTMGTPLACMIRKGKLILRADVSQRHYDKVGRITSANFAVQYGNRTYNTSDLGGRLLSVGRSSAEYRGKKSDDYCAIDTCSCA